MARRIGKVLLIMVMAAMVMALLAGCKKEPPVTLDECMKTLEEWKNKNTAKAEEVNKKYEPKMQEAMAKIMPKALELATLPEAEQEAGKKKLIEETKQEIMPITKEMITEMVTTVGAPKGCIDVMVAETEKKFEEGLNASDSAPPSAPPSNP